MYRIVTNSSSTSFTVSVMDDKGISVIATDDIIPNDIIPNDIIIDELTNFTIIAIIMKHFALLYETHCKVNV